MGVVVRRYNIDILIIIIIFPYILHLYISALFWQQHTYFFVHFFNVFSFLFMLFLCNVIIIIF